jgi:hypothetical protein
MISIFIKMINFVQSERERERNQSSNLIGNDDSPLIDLLNSYIIVVVYAEKSIFEVEESVSNYSVLYTVEANTTHIQKTYFKCTFRGQKKAATTLFPNGRKDENNSLIEISFVLQSLKNVLSLLRGSLLLFLFVELNVHE